jgi:hypothetical protein
MIFAKGGLIFFALNGNQPNSVRMACSLNSVDPHIREAPKIPSSAELQRVDMKSDPTTRSNPTPIIYGHQSKPRYRSPRITHMKPNPIISNVAIPINGPNRLIDYSRKETFENS